MKKMTGKKIKALTLIEILVAMTIFAIVALIVMSTLSMGISTKSKVIAYNNIRKQGAAVMAEIQDMVENGNGFPGSPNPGVFISNSSGGVIPISPSKCLTGDHNVTGSGIFMAQTGRDNWAQRKILALSPDGTIKIRKRILKCSSSTNCPDTDTWADPGLFADGWLSIIDDNNVKVNSFVITGYYNNTQSKINAGGAGCSNLATRINVIIELSAKSAGVTGEAATVKLNSTFTPKHPAPQRAADSI